MEMEGISAFGEDLVFPYFLPSMARVFRRILGVQGIYPVLTLAPSDKHCLGKPLGWLTLSLIGGEEMVGDALCVTLAWQAESAVMQTSPRGVGRQ